MKAPKLKGRQRIEWEKVLNPEQFRILRERGTEPAFTGRYLDEKERGVYICAGCKEAGEETQLFRSGSKYDSGTGWPSFSRAIRGALETRIEEDGRTEVSCGNCDGHLGHVFDDGPAPTHKRFCINSRAIYLKGEDGTIMPGKQLSEQDITRRSRESLYKGLSRMFDF